MFNYGNSNKLNLSIINISLSVFLVSLVIYLLYVGSSFLIPVVLSLSFAFFINTTYSFFKQYIKSIFISFLLTSFVYCFVFWGIYKVIYLGIINIGENSGNYINELGSYFVSLEDYIRRFFQNDIFDRIGFDLSNGINDLFVKLDITSKLENLVTYLVNASTSILGYIGTVIFYTIFILLEFRFIHDKINRIVPDQGKRNKIIETIEEIKKDIKNYFFIKILVSFLSASLSYIFMISIGLDFPLLWAFLMFCLNFIPNFGSIISISLPIILASVQFGILGKTWIMFIITAIGLIMIDVIVANVIEPKITGSKLNLSPLVILISLIFWTYIWGIVGALLSVPIMVIISIICSKFENTKWISIILSEKGELKTDITDISDTLIEKSKIFKKIKKKKK